MSRRRLSWLPTARAADDEAFKILKGMSDYLASQKTMSLSYDSDIEVITPDIEKIQFASSGKVLLSRPDKLSATRTNGLRGGCGSRSLCRKARRGSWGGQL